MISRFKRIQLSCSSNLYHGFYLWNIYINLSLSKLLLLQPQIIIVHWKIDCVCTILHNLYTCISICQADVGANPSHWSDPTIQGFQVMCFPTFTYEKSCGITSAPLCWDYDQYQKTDAFFFIVICGDGGLAQLMVFSRIWINKFYVGSSLFCSQRSTTIPLEQERKVGLVRRLIYESFHFWYFVCW